MELALTLESDGQVKVICDGQESHVFKLEDILPQPNSQQDNVIVLEDPVKIGTQLFSALFQAGTIARRSLDVSPKRILLVTVDKVLDSVPWEYLSGPDGFLVLDFDFVRGLPPDHRQAIPDLQGTLLHIIAIPSNPVSSHITPLDIDGEWRKLRESIENLSAAITLERTRPPTLEQTRRLVANQSNRVLHFMGHGGTTEQQAVLFFEDERGAPKAVTAQDFVRRLESTTFLVVLNSCEGATAGPTEFSNLAQMLVVRKIPYAIGMRFGIHDEDAKEFSRGFYDELTRGVPVENALRHARQALANSKNPWAVGTPVLYTSLREPAGGFGRAAGSPQVEEHQPVTEVTILDKAKGVFQGRVDELLALGKALTSEPRVKLLTIHGAGGQGKTALAHEAVERFAHAFPGGVFAISLETKPSRFDFCFQLAQLMKLPRDLEPADLERTILKRLQQQRTLLVLDNAETFTEAVRAKDRDALDLADFLRERLPGTPSSILVTSREPLGFPGEQVLLLEGLSAQEGAALFHQSASGRQNDIALEQAETLSLRLDGHPLALLLLGLAFNETSISLQQFMDEHQARLLQAEDRYRAEEHRHRTLYASIETSTRYLAEEHRSLLSGLWIFQAPFLPETAAQLFTPDGLSEEESKSRQEQITQQLHELFRRGLLVREVETLSDGNILLYRTLPTVRLFAQHYLPQHMTAKALQSRLAGIHARLIQTIDRQIDRTSWASYLAIRSRVDLEASVEWVEEHERGWYVNRLGWVLQRIGDRRAGMGYLERALEIAQGSDQKLELNTINNMALVYRSTGQPGKALELYEQALRIRREVGNRAGEATTLNNMAAVYQSTGQPGKALELFEQALPLMRELGDRAGEAATYNNMAAVYQSTGQPDKALELFEQALPIRRAVGDRAGEAATLNNIGMVYDSTGQPGKALELYEQALPIQREVGNRAGEATTLNNMGMVYDATGQPGKALELYEQALPIVREVGDRAGEAATYNNMAAVYQSTGQPDKALELYEQALPIRREVGDRSGEAVTCFNMAVLALDLDQPQRSLELLRQAVALKKQVQHPDYPQLAALLAQWEAALAQGQPLPGSSSNPNFPSGLAPQQVQTIQHNTLAVLTDVREKLNEWRQTIVSLLTQAQAKNLQTETDFLTAILTLLDGGTPEIAPDNPYADVIHTLSQQLARAAQGQHPQEDSPLPSELPADFVLRCVTDLQGSVEQRQALFEYLREINRKSSSSEVSTLIQSIQLVLVGRPRSSIHPDLPEPYAAVWQQIINDVS